MYSGFGTQHHALFVNRSKFFEKALKKFVPLEKCSVFVKRSYMSFQPLGSGMSSKARTLSNSLDSVLWDLQCSDKSLKYCVLWQAILEENIVSSRLWPSVTATEWLLTSSLHNKHHWPAWQTFPREFVEKIETIAKKRNKVGEGGERRKHRHPIIQRDSKQWRHCSGRNTRSHKKQPQNAKNNNNYKQTNKQIIMSTNTLEIWHK